MIFFNWYKKYSNIFFSTFFSLWIFSFSEFIRSQNLFLSPFFSLNFFLNISFSLKFFAQYFFLSIFYSLNFFPLNISLFLALFSLLQLFLSVFVSLNYFLLQFFLKNQIKFSFLRKVFFVWRFFDGQCCFDLTVFKVQNENNWKRKKYWEEKF